jgi:hypothetical protein
MGLAVLASRTAVLKPFWLSGSITGEANVRKDRGGRSSFGAGV